MWPFRKAKHGQYEACWTCHQRRNMGLPPCSVHLPRFTLPPFPEAVECRHHWHGDVLERVEPCGQREVTAERVARCCCCAREVRMHLAFGIREVLNVGGHEDGICPGLAS